MKGLLIRVDPDDGPPTVQVFDGDGDALRKAVGGSIEPVPSSEDVTFWVDEEGKLKGSPINRLAMDCWLRYDVFRCVLAGDWLAGDVVITGGVGPYGETLDIPEDVSRWVRRVARDAGVDVPRVDWERFGLVDVEDES